MRISVRRIQEAIAADFGVPMDQFLSPCRKPRVCRPRQYAMLLARELTPLSLPVLGKLFGRDHTTVLSGIRSAMKIVAGDPGTALRLEARALLFSCEPQKTVDAKFVGFFPDTAPKSQIHPQDMHSHATFVPVADMPVVEA